MKKSLLVSLCDQTWLLRVFYVCTTAPIFAFNQDKGLHWNFHLLDKNSIFLYILTQILQDKDILFTDFLISLTSLLCNLHGSKS